MTTTPASADDREARLARRRALLDEWAALEREIAVMQARQAELLADRLDLLVADPDVLPDGGDLSLRSLAAEYAAAAHIPPSTAAIRLTDAWVLVRRYSAVHASLAAGRISRRHADVIIAEAPEISDDQDAGAVRAAYEEQVVSFAEQDTAARTRSHARGVTALLCPDRVVDAHRRARASRSVTVKPDGDGMAVLTAILPEILAYAIKDRLTAQARHITRTRTTNGTAVLPGGLRPEDQEPDIPDDPEDAYEAFLRSLDSETARSAPSHPASPSPSPLPAPASPSLPEPVEECDVPGTARSVIMDADLVDEAIDLTDLSVLSPAAAAYDRTAPDPVDAPPDPAPYAPLVEPFADEQFEALVTAFYDSPLPQDPNPPGPDGRSVYATAPPSDPVGVLAADERSMDQLRADILTDLLLTTDPATVTRTGLESIRATVQVTLSATTLADQDDRPAELDGAGPLDPDIARILAGHAPSWTRLFTDPAGMVTATDGYTPTASMKRYLRARDQHCRFPGCRAPAHVCEIDHNHDHARGGRTEICNLANFCTGHHPIKHPDVPDEHRWTARQLEDGLIAWTSPLGRTYTDHAPRRVMFT